MFVVFGSKDEEEWRFFVDGIGLREERYIIYWVDLGSVRIIIVKFDCSCEFELCRFM